MRVFVTGASGWIGSAVVPELIGAGHQVLGLARSDTSADALAAAGASVQRGDLDDLDSLRSGAAASDGVIHLAFHHDFSRFADAAQSDLRAIEAMGAVLAGSERPLIIASGVLGLPSDRVVTERDMPGPEAGPRAENAQVTLDLAGRGVRSSVVRLAPTVHDREKTGFVGRLVDVAREQGNSGFIDNGANHWPAVNRRDAARLFRLALESAPAGSILHGVGEEGIPIRTIALVIGRHLDVPVVSIPSNEANAHFGWLASFLAMDCQASNALTRELLGWQPTHPGLIDDLEHGHFFDSPSV